MTTKRGFTLIEILVVIALIGVLAGILLVSFQGVRKSARDGRRKADIEQIRAGLEMCRQETRVYPNNLPGCALVPAGITDPLSGYRYVYSKISDTAYSLCAYLEAGPETPCAGVACGGNCNVGASTACNYKTCNP